MWKLPGVYCLKMGRNFPGWSEDQRLPFQMRLRKLWLKAGDQKKCLEIWGCQISNTKRKYGFNLKGTNVTVNAVLPCPTVTDATKDMFEQIAKEHKVPVEEAPAVFIWGKRPSSFKGLPPRKKSPIWWSMWQALYLQLQQ